MSYLIVDKDAVKINGVYLIMKQKVTIHVIEKRRRWEIIIGNSNTQSDFKEN